LKSYLFKRVTIVGVGLMGGSVGLAIRKHRLAKEVVGLSQKQSSLVAAIKKKAIDTACSDVSKAIRNADLVILATPVDSIIKLLSTISPYLRRGCVVTDIGSSKVEIVKAAEKVLGNGVNFVGSHPLVGSEKQGVEFATAELFDHSQCIMTPIKKTNNSAREKVKKLWSRVGCEVTILSAQEHDEIMAYTSHLPHLLAFGLTEIISQEHLKFAARGLLDTTRIAGSSPQMWNDICLSNSQNVLKSLDHFVKDLSILRKAIVNKDQKTLLEYLTKAQEKRNAIV
ncbi:hypothetical protein MNBD_BACTEROID05-744, partial [hydrothermal vent metagenome]